MYTYKVFMESGRCRLLATEFDALKEAEEFCDFFEWEIVDENNFPWALTIEEEEKMAPKCKEPKKRHSRGYLDNLRTM